MSSKHQSRPLVLITGSTQGLGLIVAKALASEHSYHVLLGVRNAKKGQEIADEIIQSGHQASVVELDLSSEQSVNAAVKSIENEFGYLDILINNAGISIDHETSLTKWELYNKTFTTNVMGPAVLTEGLLPLLRKAQHSPPRIVFLSSTMGSCEMSLDKTSLCYNIDYKSYDASKAAVNMLTINFSRELDAVGGKVNVVCPGFLKTNLTRWSEYAENPESGAAQVVKMATVGVDGPTGTFTNRQGTVPW